MIGAFLRIRFGRGRFRILAALILVSLMTYQAAGETITLSLEEAVGRALNQSLNLKKAAIDLAQAEYSAGRLWSEIFPGFSLRAGLDFLPSTPLVTDPGFSYRTDALSYSINAGISFTLAPSFSSSMKRIELAYRGQLLSYEDASKRLEIDTAKSFFNLITMKANISYMEQSLEVAAQKMNSDSIARQNGLLSELAWLNSQLSVQTARYNLSNAQASYQNSLREFLAVLGMDADQDVILDGVIEIAPVDLDPEQLILDYLPKRPDIIAQRQTIERLELTRDIATLNARAPSLSLSTTWQLGSSGSSAPFTDRLSGSLALSIPIDSWIPGTRQNQSIRSADADLEKAKLDLQNTEAQARNRIRSLVSNLQSTWENLDIARMRVEIAQATVAATEEGFRRGTVESRELEDRRNDLSDARQRLLQGENSYQSLILDLAAALNVDWKTLTRSLP
jgi:multidrug efflux system outer membrane protein